MNRAKNSGGRCGYDGLHAWNAKNQFGSFLSEVFEVWLKKKKKVPLFGAPSSGYKQNYFSSSDKGHLPAWLVFLLMKDLGISELQHRNRVVFATPFLLT